MATLLEIHEMMGTPETGDFKKKIRTAITIKAKLIAASSDPTAAEITWAKMALHSLDTIFDQVLRFVVADNANLTVSQIQNASDAPIQTSVNKAIDTLLSK